MYYKKEKKGEQSQWYITVQITEILPLNIINLLPDRRTVKEGALAFLS